MDQTMPSGIRGKLQQQRVRLKSLGRSCSVSFTVQDPEVTGPMRSHSRLDGRNQADAAIFSAPRDTRSPIGRKGEAA